MGETKKGQEHLQRAREREETPGKIASVKKINQALHLTMELQQPFLMPQRLTIGTWKWKLLKARLAGREDLVGRVLLDLASTLD
jgi:hypothetical protein